jgi:hypothetical protein
MYSEDMFIEKQDIERVTLYRSACLSRIPKENRAVSNTERFLKSSSLALTSIEAIQVGQCVKCVRGITPSAGWEYGWVEKQNVGTL